jgi:methylmalonyl-CoA/ethylmalonyl-CoA epimerase
MDSFKLHHVGFAVPEIESTSRLYVRRYQYTICSPVIHDPIQTAYVQFLRLPGDHVYLELVAPDSPQSKLTKAISKGGGLNHLCYSVERMDEAITALRATEMALICAPIEAVAFTGRKIAWLLGRDPLPVELVERAKNGEL